MPRQSFFVTIMQAAIGIIVIALAWEIWARSKSYPLLYPTLSQAFGGFGELMADPKFRTHISATFGAFVQGFLPAAMIAIPIGLALRVHHLLRLILVSPVLVLGAAPLIVMGPMIVVLQGLGPESKATMAFWMSLTGIFYGMMAHRPGVAMTGDVPTNARLREWISAIAAGLRCGILFCIAGVAVLEMIGGNAGLGFFLMETFARLEVARMLAAILTLMLPTVIAVVLLQALELHLSDIR